MKIKFRHDGTSTIRAAVDGQIAGPEETDRIVNALNNDYMSSVIVAAMPQALPVLTELPLTEFCGLDLAKGLDALYMANTNTAARAAIVKARDADVDWKSIILALLGQVPNMLAGNWVAVVAAVIGLIVPKP